MIFKLLFQSTCGRNNLLQYLSLGTSITKIADDDDSTPSTEGVVYNNYFIIQSVLFSLFSSCQCQLVANIFFLKIK